MYNNILVPVVFETGHDAKASFEAARALAEEGASFTVLHVMEAIPNYVAMEIPAEVIQKGLDEAKQALVNSAKELPDAKPVLVHGTPGRAIIEYAHFNGIDCIVIASHQMDLTDILLGSTASKVVRNATCSVHVVR